MRLPAQTPTPFPLSHTGLTTDLAIIGEGWFVLRDPVRQQTYLESFGAFRLNGDGFLISQTGERVQGVSTTTGEPLDVQLPWGGGKEVLGYGFDSLGLLTVSWSDGTQETPQCLLLARTPAPADLQPSGMDRYLVRGPLTTAVPGSNGLGTILAGALTRKAPPTMPTRISPPRPLNSAEPPGLTIVTGIPTDFALQNKGFFLLRDPVTNRKLLTRQGAFKETCVVKGGKRSTFITTYDGLRLQLRRNGDLADLDLASEGFMPPGSERLWWTVGRDGKVAVIVLDYMYGITEPSLGTLAILEVPDLNQLVPAGPGRYELPDHPESPAIELPASAIGLVVGALEQGWLTPELCSQRLAVRFFAQGSLWHTGRPLDLAIDGEGLFLLREPITGELFASRAGAFELDPQGYFVSQNLRFFPVSPTQPFDLLSFQGIPAEPTVPGLRLQGYVGDLESSPPQVGDLRIDPALGSDTGTTLSGLSIVPDGLIRAVLSNGTQVVCGQVLLQRFAEPSQLARATVPDDTVTRIVYRVTPEAFPEELSVPGCPVAGKVQSGCLELIQLDQRPLTSTDPTLRRFTLTGMPDTPYQIEATTDLQHWMVVGLCRTDWSGTAQVVVKAQTHPHTIYPLPAAWFWPESATSSSVVIEDPGPTAFYRAVR